MPFALLQGINIVCISLVQLYKHVVQIVEKFIKKVIVLFSIIFFFFLQCCERCIFSGSLFARVFVRTALKCVILFFQCKPEYKVPGLYVVDSIVRQSRHQFGADKDVFGPRFTKNITGTFENLCLCPTEDRVRVIVLCLELSCKSHILWLNPFGMSGQ